MVTTPRLSLVSTLGFALLGLLARQPATGYDLARDLRRPVGYFWHARHSQIYPTLTQLEADGMVTHEVIAGAGPRPTKQYRVTRSGRSAVRRWLRETTPEVDDREILLRVYLVWLLPTRDALAMLAAIREHHVRTLEHFLGLLVGRDDAATVSPLDPLFGERATLDWGVVFERGRIAWIDRTIHEIQNGESR